MSGLQIAELSARIAANTAKVDQYHVDNGIPSPSFDHNGPLKCLVPAEAVDVEAARQAVIHDCQELRTLMLGPTEFLTDFGFTVRYGEGFGRQEIDGDTQLTGSLALSAGASPGNHSLGPGPKSS